jgi:hypothetical protein
VIDHIPPCPSCNTKFQIWEADQPLLQDHTYLFSSYYNDSLQKQVHDCLNNASTQEKNENDSSRMATNS